jgi:hypothetical protein
VTSTSHAEKLALAVGPGGRAEPEVVITAPAPGEPGRAELVDLVAELLLELLLLELLDPADVDAEQTGRRTR